MSARICVYVCMYGYTYVYIPASPHTYTCALHTYIHNICIHTSAYTCMINLFKMMPPSPHKYTCAYIHTYIHTYTHTHTRAYTCIIYLFKMMPPSPRRISAHNVLTMLFSSSGLTKPVGCTYHVCMCVCMYAVYVCSMYVHTYVCMYVCFDHVILVFWVHKASRIHLSCMHVCMYVCLLAYTYTYSYVHICIHKSYLNIL
jgi:hypothetical protein